VGWHHQLALENRKSAPDWQSRTVRRHQQLTGPETWRAGRRAGTEGPSGPPDEDRRHRRGDDSLRTDGAGRASSGQIVIDTNNYTPAMATSQNRQRVDDDRRTPAGAPTDVSRRRSTIYAAAPMTGDPQAPRIAVRWSSPATTPRAKPRRACSTSSGSIRRMRVR
jgi:hypothetical protein